MSGRIKTYVAKTGGTWAIPGRADAPGGGTSTTTLLNTNFDNLTTADPMSITQFRQALNVTTGGGSTTVARTGIRPSTGRGKVLVQHFHANQFGTADGIAYFAPLATPCTEATITYKVKFTSVGANPFHFGQGGKLPGLGGIVPGRGNPPTGGNPSAYGWSSRGMWLHDKVGGNVLNQTELIAYMYDPTQTNVGDTYGQNRHTLWVPPIDTWIDVRQYHKINDHQSDPTSVDATTGATTGGSWSANGIHRMWAALPGENLADNLLFQKTDQVYRKFKQAIITHILWSNFYGGATQAWGPPHDTDIEYDDVVVEMLAA